MSGQTVVGQAPVKATGARPRDVRFTFTTAGVSTAPTLAKKSSRDVATAVYTDVGKYTITLRSSHGTLEAHGCSALSATAYHVQLVSCTLSGSSAAVLVVQVSDMAGSAVETTGVDISVRLNFNDSDAA